MAMSPASDWIEHLQLQQHIEGGWYKETYRSPLFLHRENAPGLVNGDRSLCTHIYFLLQQNEFSALHRIGSDELWHFYDGDTLVVYEIDMSGQLTEHRLGNDPANGLLPFCMIRKGSWFGSRLAPGGNYALVGCTVAPGFDFADFELATASGLSGQFPQHKDLIASLCRLA